MLSGQCYLDQKGQSYCGQKGQFFLAKGVKFVWLFHMVIDPKATMSGYINNIVDEHLKKYSPEIMKLYKDKES